MANRHDIYIWEASAEDLTKDLVELIETGVTYAEVFQTPTENLQRFAQALEQYQQQLPSIYDDSQGFLKVWLMRLLS
jgi:hypothetical protein